MERRWHENECQQRKAAFAKHSEKVQVTRHISATLKKKKE